MASSGAKDAWASGDAYEPYVGRWSRKVAQVFLGWLSVPTGARWLDVGCGTGALSSVILNAASPTEVVGIDPSNAYVTWAKSHLEDERSSFRLGDARNLPVPSAMFDVVVSGLVLNFVPEPVSAVREMARAARMGGVVAAYVWDYAHGMELMRRFWDAAVRLDPAAVDLDEGRRFAGTCQPDALAALFEDAELRAVETRAIDVPMVFRDFDDFWQPFLGGQGPAPGYVATLDETHRYALREHLRAELPVAGDGKIALAARAWAVRGERSRASGHGPHPALRDVAQKARFCLPGGDFPVSCGGL
ncbi:MAG: class I SAM-dependent methyltransferase [Chloroflexota bacterium]|nr:class I SAM-dependent methyltransferase [Chloroflexota bacterium]